MSRQDAWRTRAMVVRAGLQRFTAGNYRDREAPRSGTVCCASTGPSLTTDSGELGWSRLQL